VNNKSVALPSRSPRAGVTYLRIVRARHSRARTRTRVLAVGLVQTGSHDDVTDAELNPTMRGQPEFVGLEFAEGGRASERGNEC